MSYNKRLTPRQKLALIRLVEEKKETISSVCRRYGISRKTFYHWRKRYYLSKAEKKPSLVS
ncbi:transposase, partial [bacterium]|nr:transposase [bacterium]NIO17949.1 transposase [bacterium]NIO73268.1 transposase [bacterium]